MQIVIIGNGIAGSTAARFLRKQSDHSILMISEESDYFFSRTALMYVYMGHLREQDLFPYEPSFWKKNRIDLLRAKVVQFDFENKKIQTDSGTSINYDVLVFATGSKPFLPDIKGIDLEGVSGLYHWQDLQYIASKSKGLNKAVVVGGGLIGVELAEMFHSRQIPVTFLIRESSYWSNVLPTEESLMIGQHLMAHGIDCRYKTSVKAILSDESGRCAAVLTDQGEQITTDFVGITTGVVPNVEAFRSSGLEINKGILVDEYLRTNLPGVYAIGDCVEVKKPTFGRKSIEAVWYTGRKMGETVAATILGKPTVYDPGTWFNSAKFFDLEYQVYGTIDPQLPPDIETLYWSDGSTRSIRINFRRSDTSVVGFNLIGVRYRQEVCLRWIEHACGIEKVLEELAFANFDPEFTSEVESAVIVVYNQKYGRQVKLKSKRSLTSIINFFKK